MREIFYELIQEAANGKVNLFHDTWPVGFNTKILKDSKEKCFYKNDRNLSMLYIKDEERFFQLLEEYLEKEQRANRKLPAYASEKDRIKGLMTYLFVYATTEDFINPIEYIQKKIDFLEDHTFDELEEKISISLGQKLNANIEIKQETNSISMETPKRITIQLTHPEKEDVAYPLPSIYYAIRNENGKKVCYIYSLLKPKEAKNPSEEQMRFHKKMNRLLFKINDGITETDDYKEEDDTNIRDVSMSFVLCLNIFISLLQQKGIEEIKAVPYLPVCYLAREIFASESEKAEELRERNKRIQENQTNKFIRTFRRLSAQNEALNIESYPYEYDEFLTMTLAPRTKEIDNMLLEESNRAVIEKWTK